MKKTITAILCIIICLTVVIISEKSLYPTDVPEETDFGWSLYDKNKDNGIEMEVFTENLDYEYARISMETLHYRSVSFDVGIHIPYITAESQLMTRREPYCRRITSVEELDALIALICARRGTDLPADDPYGLVLMYNSISGSIDEAFFRENHLYTVEFGFEGNTFLRSRIDSMTESDNHLTIAVSYETVHAATAGYPAELLFIAIPADVDSVEVTMTETAWLQEWDLEK